MTQYFKGDVRELQFFNSGAPLLDLLSAEKDAFFDDAFGCFVLGELLYDNDLAPLTNAISRDVFRESFESVFDAFIVAGTFESYLTVFRKVFGDDVDVTFTVPGAGQLQIDIVASGLVLSNFQSRRIVDGGYVFADVLTKGGENIEFQRVKGFDTQYEVEQMLFELVPAGIFTDINLTV